MRDDMFNRLRTTVLQVCGVDLNYYRTAQLERRLQSLVDKHSLPDLDALARRLRSEPEEAARFCDFLTINVTEFLRNPERFFAVGERTLPALLAERRPLSIWSAGCSTGAEPYSLAMLLHRLDPKGDHRILASDIDSNVLGFAAAGVYHREALANVPADWRERYFESTPAGWRVKDVLRRWVTFRRHDLLSDVHPGNLDLIVCRNVVIYFNAEGKRRVYQGFWRALRPGGFLWVGGTETIWDSRQIGFGQAEPFLYRRLAAPVPAEGSLMSGGVRR